jgi:glycosyltransferase involved in cell wall biosynthesis
VVISTYNGAAVLPRALDSLLEQDVGDVRYEVTVVDNNSDDGTRGVIESYSPGTAARLRYLFEGRQGVSYGRNAGIRASVGPVVAFSDDDVRVSRDWVRSIKTLMDEHPQADFIGGKVLPEWTGAPPAWLTPANWSPLALVDYGATPVFVDYERQVCLVTANLAVRRGLLDSIGLFSPELQRIKDSIGSMEDHELLIRSWRAGKLGLYAPGLIVTTAVPQHRMTKEYHRRWHAGHGVFCARMRLLEQEHDDRAAADGSAKEPLMFFGVPGYVHRQVVSHVRRWIAACIRRRPAAAFMHESTVRFTLSYLRTRYRDERAQNQRSVAAELGSFTKDLLRKKVRTAFGRS